MGYNTPNGSYRPERLARQWFSRKYDWSPMPYSIFFHGGYAIHGSYEISRLGRPASHGCIRLHPANAAVLYRLVEANRGNTRIVVTGDRPEPVVARAPLHRRRKCTATSSSANGAAAATSRKSSIPTGPDIRAGAERRRQRRANAATRLTTCASRPLKPW